jgi:hypothetical protein
LVSTGFDFFGFFLTHGFAASIEAGVSGTFYVGGTLTFAGKVLPAGTYDVNIQILDKSTGQAVHTASGKTDANGVFSWSWSDFNAGDYNAKITDVNDGIYTVLEFTVTKVADVDINFLSHLPPFELGENISFALLPYDVNGNALTDYNLYVKVLAPDGNKIYDVNVGKSQSSNWSETITISASKFSSPGIYVIVVNQGVKSFSLPVLSFMLFVTTKNDVTGDVSNYFGPADTVKIQVAMRSVDGTQLYSGQGNSVSITLVKPDGNTQSLAVSSSGGFFYATLSLGGLPYGTYVLRVAATHNNVTQKKAVKFHLSRYKLGLAPKKSAMMGKKERMPGIVAPSSPAQLELTLKDLSTGLGLLANDFNCEDQASKFSFKLVSKLGKVVDINDVNFKQRVDACDVNVLTPSTSGTYTLVASATDLNVKGNIVSLEARVTIIIQRFVVFMDPVDPVAFKNTPQGAWKFRFFKDENIGFTPVVFDIYTGNPVVVTAVRGVIFHVGQTKKKVASQYYDFNASIQLLELDKSVITDYNIPGGFVPMSFIVDVNGLDGNNVKALGAFRLKLLNVEVFAADENGKARSFEFGPPTYKANDENVYVLVMVKNSAGQSISYATVKIKELRNMDQWEDVNVEAFPTATTDSKGKAVINLGKMPSGTYFGLVEADDGKNKDYGELFLIVKSYIVHAEPLLYEPSTQACSFAQGFSSDDNVMLGVIVGMPSADNFDFNFINNFDLNVKVYMMGEEDELSEPKRIDVNYQLGDVNCTTDFLGPPRDTNVIILERQGGWKKGFYRVQLRAYVQGLGYELGDGFFKIQPFRFYLDSAVPKQQTGPFADKASPGMWFDFNVFSSKDVNITDVLLLDNKSFEPEFFLQDINVKRKSDGVDLRFNNDTDITANTHITISILIPDTARLEPYTLVVVAEDENGNEAEGELWLSMVAFTVVIPRGRYGGLPTMRYAQEPGVGYDANVIDDCVRDYNLLSADVGNISYDRFVHPREWEYGGNDLNVFVLVDTANKLLYVDKTKDCNFLNDGNNMYTVGPTITDVNTPDGNQVVFVDVGAFDVKILLAPFNFTQKPDVEHFVGRYARDVNMPIPVFVKSVDGTPVSGATVSITRVMRISFGEGMPKELSDKDWNGYSAVTDANGLAIPRLQVAAPGQYVLSLTIEKGTKKQTLMPWDGPVVEVKAYDAFLNLSKPTEFTIDNNITPFDIFVSFDPSYYIATSYGVFDEAAQQYDLDQDNNMQEIWYFVRLTPTGSQVLSQQGDFKEPWIILDDDKDMTLTDPPGMDANNSPEKGESSEVILSPFSTECIADFNFQYWGGNYCRLREATYVLSEKDLNWIDSDTKFYARINHRECEGNACWSLWVNKNQINAVDRNVTLWIEVRDFNLQRLSNASGTVKVRLFEWINDYTRIPLSGVWQGNVYRGVARISVGDLEQGKYEVAMDLNVNGMAGTAYDRFEVRG